MKRRNFLTLAAAAPALNAAPAKLDSIHTRKVGKVEIVFKSPGPQPNGLQATKDGLWIIDQGAGNKAYLVSYEDGKVLRSFETETDKSSGITFDGEALWIGSTYSREIVRTDAMTGKAIERHFTPGAGVIYKMVGDPPARSSPLAKERQRPAGAKKGSGQQVVGGFQQGQVMGGAAPGTGAHGQEWRDGKLWFAVPPSREIYPSTRRIGSSRQSFPRPATVPMESDGKVNTCGPPIQTGTRFLNTIRKRARWSKRFSWPIAIRFPTA
jgi:hypothetical protein